MLHYDPVCGKRVNRNKAHIVIEYRGEEFLLCCPKCQSEFEDDPARFTRNGGSKPRGRKSSK